MRVITEWEVSGRRIDFVVGISFNSMLHKAGGTFLPEIFSSCRLQNVCGRWKHRLDDEHDYFKHLIPQQTVNMAYPHLP